MAHPGGLRHARRALAHKQHVLHDKVRGLLPTPRQMRMLRLLACAGSARSQVYRLPRASHPMGDCRGWAPPRQP
eukprot:4247677-Pyramimonas_sp.AAC.1